MRRGPRRASPPKMGYEPTAPGGRRRAVEASSGDRLSAAGVSFTYGKLAGWICSVCTSATDLRGMLRHAQGHAPELARRAVQERIAGVLRPLDAEQLEAVLAVLPAVIANPDGFGVVARALTSGEVKHPGRGLGPSADQTVGDHLAAELRHAKRSAAPHDVGAWLAGRDVELAIDPDTGEPHAGLASARGVLAVQRDIDRRRG
jgi:hypothetical protein